MYVSIPLFILLLAIFASLIGIALYTSLEARAVARHALAADAATMQALIDYQNATVERLKRLQQTLDAINYGRDNV